jgi:hypothetical protein
LNAASSNYITYDTLTALSVSGLASAVIHGGNVAKKSAVRQISDPRLAVTGGTISTIKGRTYLVFGQVFQGGYIPFVTTPPSFTQIYTDEIRSFKIGDNGKTLAIRQYQALRDTTNFRRRDGNLNEVVMPCGAQVLSYYGGVFTPGNNSTALSAPILIQSTTKARVDSDYQQFFDQYATASIPLYSTRKKAMYTVFLGGISVYDYSNGQLTMFPPGIPGPGWVDDVSTLVHRKNGSDREYIMSPLPGLYGAYAAFMPSPSLPTYRNGVIKLEKLKKPTVLGYMYGGIYSTVVQTSPDPSVGATQTGASNAVFMVTVSRSCVKGPNVERGCSGPARA